MQILALSKDPRLLPSIGKFLNNLAHEKNIPNPKVTAKIQVSVNSRPAYYVVDTTLNLAIINYKYGSKMDWLRSEK